MRCELLLVGHHHWRPDWHSHGQPCRKVHGHAHGHVPMPMKMGMSHSPCQNLGQDNTAKVRKPWELWVQCHRALSPCVRLHITCVKIAKHIETVCVVWCGTAPFAHMRIVTESGMDCGNRAGMLLAHATLTAMLNKGGTVAAISPCTLCTLLACRVLRKRAFGPAGGADRRAFITAVSVSQNKPA